MLVVVIVVDTSKLLVEHPAPDNPFIHSIGSNPWSIETRKTEERADVV
jgi:hypothetical protein